MRFSCRIGPAVLVLVGLLSAGSPVPAQSAFQDDFVEAMPLERPPQPPQMAFELLRSIAIPGPLEERGPRVEGDTIRIPTARGLAITPWTAEVEPRLIPAEPEAAVDGETSRAWVEAPDGRRRYRALPEGRIVSEKRCRRCDDGWRRGWSLRVSGSTVASPLVATDWIYFGSLDNHVYCLKRKNGHRIWASDVEGRVSRPVVRWRIPSRPEFGSELILVVPDDGLRMLALSARTGDVVATYTLPENEGELVGVPQTTPDGLVAVAQQRYVETEASLLVFRIREIEEESDSPAEDEEAPPDIEDDGAPVVQDSRAPHTSRPPSSATTAPIANEAPRD